MGKAHSCCYFLSKPPRAFGTPGRSDPKADGVQGKFSCQEKNPAEKTPQLHFLKSSWVLWPVVTQLESTRTGLDFLYSENVLFNLLSLLYIFSIGEESEREKCCPKPWVLSFACLCHSGKKGAFFACGEQWGHFHMMVLIMPQSLGLSFVTYCGQMPFVVVTSGPQLASPERQGQWFLHSLPSSQAVPSTPLTATLVRLWNSWCVEL